MRFSRKQIGLISPDKSGENEAEVIYSTALTMSSMTFFASPKTIMVLSR